MSDLSVPEIETDRFLLRQITNDDLDEWIRIKYSDPQVMRYMPVRDASPRDRAQQAYDFFNRTWSQHGFGGWVITNKTSGQLLGDCYLEPEEESGSGEVELGYTIGRPFWGQGVATETGRAVVRFGFEHANLQRILGVAMPENIGSWRVLGKIGFVFEKKAHLYDLDVLVYAILPKLFKPGSAFYNLRKS